MEPEESKSNRDKDNKSELAGEQLDLKPGTTFETKPGLGFTSGNFLCLFC